MQRGPLLQPLRSTELVLSGPPRAHPSGCVQPFRLRRAQHRQAHRGSHCLSFVGLPLSHLSRSTEEANPPSGRVFLSAFSPKKPHSFPRGKPRSAPLSPRRIRLTPFPQSCHGFVLAPSSRQKPRQPRVSANLSSWGFTPEPSPSKKSNPEYRLRFFSGSLFRSPEKSSLPAAFADLPELPCLQPFVWNLTPFLYAAVCGIFRRCCVVAVPAPLPGARYAWQSDFACGDSAPRRYSVPLYRLDAAKFSNLWNPMRTRTQ